MNNAYRVVWNAVTNTWTAVSEHARGHRKGASQGTRAAAITLTAIAAGLCFATSAHAYVAGTGAQQGNANNTVIGDNANGSAAGCNSTYLPGSACSTIIGNSASSTGSATTVIGDHASTSGANSTAIGAYANAVAWSQAIGTGATASNSWATAIGQSAKALGANTNAIGTNSTASGSGSTAIGSSARALTDNSVALGYNANSSGTGSIAFGNSTTASASNAVALGSNSMASRDNTVSVGSATSTRQIVNVGAGTQDTDAVNLAQLKSTAQSAANSLGGGAAVNADGTIAAPAYDVADIVNGGSKTVSNVGDALGQLNANTVNLDGRVTKSEGDIVSLDQRVTTNEGNITNLLDGKAGLVQQTAAGADLTVGAGTDGARVNFADKSGNARTLANVANGVADSDAVNVSQLKAAQNQIGDLDQLAVKYGDASQASITLGGTGGTQIHNVADGTA
ncbi:ESPR-type extended signal peptide-containing protein, partial [Burkholderia diffusa]|uniref:ESPR-type extended signal peptide-containing protein n=1 Tax=Burkholderia diffusa TaxID=488732 RepID=UPI0022AA65C6